MDEVVADPHFVERGFAVTVRDPRVGRDVTYPGSPFRSETAPWRLARLAPQLGQHDAEVLDPLR